MSEAATIQPDIGKDWYSVDQATGYLGISRPTLFRWMRQGMLSFYKVGGSTRFSKANLDSVVEKTTGLKEAEALSTRCACCGHSVMIEGKVQGTGNLFFRPMKTRFWIFSEGLVPIRGRTCAACGYIQLHADTSRLTRLTRSGPGKVAGEDGVQKNKGERQ